MTKTLLRALFACCLLLSASCKKKPPVDPCVSNCLLHAKELGCQHPERCEPTCQKVKQAVACKKPLDAFMTCALTQKKDEWECSAEGIPVLQHRACEHQQDDMLICLQDSQGKL